METKNYQGSSDLQLEEPMAELPNLNCRLQDELNKFMDTNREVRYKLNNILSYNYDEKGSDEKVSKVEEATTVNKLRSIIYSFKEENDFLMNTLKHLDKII